MSGKATWPCPEKPELLLGQPIGMYHCPYCGELQMAGLPHLYPQLLELWDLEPWFAFCLVWREIATCIDLVAQDAQAGFGR